MLLFWLCFYLFCVFIWRAAQYRLLCSCRGLLWPDGGDAVLNVLFFYFYHTERTVKEVRFLLMTMWLLCLFFLPNREVFREKYYGAGSEPRTAFWSLPCILHFIPWNSHTVTFFTTHSGRSQIQAVEKPKPPTHQRLRRQRSDPNRISSTCT